VSQENVFRKQSNDSSCVWQSSYRVAHLLAKGSRASSDGEFVSKCLKHKVRNLS